MALCLCALCGVQAQTIQNGSKWWDGSVLYTAKVSGSAVTLNGVDAHEGGYRLEMVKPDGAKAGEYVLTNPGENALSVRIKAGAKVNYIRQDGMYFLAFRNAKGDAAWTMVLTPDNLQNCIGQEKYAEEQPVSDIITGMLLNTTYLGKFSKDQLRLMRNEILARHGWKFQSQDLRDHFASQPWYKPVANNSSIKLSIIEQTNVQLIKSEEAVPEGFREYDVMGDVDQSDFPGGLAEDGRGPDEINGEQVWTVTTESEFFAALGSNRTILIAADKHLNLSRILENESYFRNFPGRRWAASASSIVSKEPLVVSESETDGQQLALVNMSNLIIRGERNSSIEVDPRYSYCIYFVNCDHCEVQNLTIGHTEGGFCSGGVIGVRGGRQNVVKDCDLYGCGTYGLDLMETTDFCMINSNIHDCTYGIMQLVSCVAVKFNKCDFFNNREYSLVEGRGNEGLTFDDCRFFANWGDAPLFTLDNTFYLMGCQVYHPTENLGRMDVCEQLGRKSFFSPNPLDNDIKTRDIGPDRSK